MSGNKTLNNSRSVIENKIDLGDGKLVHKASAVKYLNSDNLKTSSDRLRRVRGYSNVPCGDAIENENNDEYVDLDNILVGDVLVSKLYAINDDEVF